MFRSNFLYVHYCRQFSTEASPTRLAKLCWSCASGICMCWCCAGRASCPNLEVALVVYVSVCVCLRACICGGVCVSLCVCYGCLGVCVCVCVYLRLCVGMCVCVSVSASFSLCLCVCLCACAVCMYIPLLHRTGGMPIPLLGRGV